MLSTKMDIRRGLLVNKDDSEVHIKKNDGKQGSGGEGLNPNKDSFKIK